MFLRRINRNKQEFTGLLNDRSKHTTASLQIEMLLCSERKLTNEDSSKKVAG